MLHTKSLFLQTHIKNITRLFCLWLVCHEIIIFIAINFACLFLSQYHESCQPKKPSYLSNTKQPPLTDAQLQKADMVTGDRIWKQSVGKEQKGLQKWETTWGYLTEYDSKVTQQINQQSQTFFMNKQFFWKRQY